MNDQLFDVLAVEFESSTVTLMTTGATERNAEAVIGMAVARRGVDEAFFTMAPAGQYADGDTYQDSDQ